MHATQPGLRLVTVLPATYASQIELIGKPQLHQLFDGPVDGGPANARFPLALRGRFFER
ncbi:MAG: hypothetical protein IT166_11490 [Bryobacterales bacterium]|nr:hypothetical protein [Bryobacterales bacterium]